MFRLPEEGELTQAILAEPMLKYQLIGLKMVGYFYPTSKPWSKYHHFRGLVTSMSFFLFNISQYIDMVMLWGNLNEMMITASTTIQFTTLLFRMEKFYANRSSTYFKFDQRNEKNHTQISSPVFYRLVREVSADVRDGLTNYSPAEKLILNEGITYSKQISATFVILGLLTGHTMVSYTLFSHFYLHPDEPPMPILRCWLPTKNVYINYAVQAYMVKIFHSPKRLNLTFSKIY